MEERVNYGEFVVQITYMMCLISEMLHNFDCFPRYCVIAYYSNAELVPKVFPHYSLSIPGLFGGSSK